MSEEVVKPGAPTPPKMVLNTAERVSPPGLDPNKRKTSRVDLAAAQAAVSSAVLKSATTRITLPTMPAAAPQGFTPKTIRLTRPGGRPATPIVPAHAAALSASGRVVATPLPADAAKRQTSRIPLENAMAVPETAPAAGETAKTLRLKRPEESAGAANLAMPAMEADAVSEQTPGDVPQATQRKTIRIKRPTGGKSAPMAVPRSMAVARIEAEAALRAADSLEQPVGVLWPVLAAVALLVTCVLVYALAVQAVPSWGLSFPGQITG